jgi:hypothetical protein
MFFNYDVIDSLTVKAAPANRIILSYSGRQDIAETEALI